MRALADRAFGRTAGAQLVPGNRVRILKDAAENFPAWLEAIRAAERTVYFESYIIGDDRVGREFVQALAERARAGVRVRLLYDWLGTRASRSLFAPLVAAGGSVRVFNPPRLDSPVGWLTRDHRKSIAVDGRVGFVSGLCASARWLGDSGPQARPLARHRGRDPRPGRRRDRARVRTGLGRVRRDPIDEAELTPADAIEVAGDVSLRVIATVPNSGGLLRLDQLIAAAARGAALAHGCVLRRRHAVRSGALRCRARRRGRPAARPGRERPPGREPGFARRLPAAARRRRARLRVERQHAAREERRRRRALDARRLDQPQHRELAHQLRARRRDRGRAARRRDGGDLRAGPRQRDRDRARETVPGSRVARVVRAAAWPADALGQRGARRGRCGRRRCRGGRGAHEADAPSAPPRRTCSASSR